MAHQANGLFCFYAGLGGLAGDVYLDKDLLDLAQRTGSFVQLLCQVKAVY